MGLASGEAYGNGLDGARDEVFTATMKDDTRGKWNEVVSRRRIILWQFPIDKRMTSLAYGPTLVLFKTPKQYVKCNLLRQVSSLIGTVCLTPNKPVVDSLGKAEGSQ